MADWTNPAYVTETDKFVFFWRGWPSQFYPSPFQIDGVHFTCAEQYMQAEKARFFIKRHSDNAAVVQENTDILNAILATNSPRQQKDLGNSVKGFIDSEWVKVVRQIVYQANLAKFIQNDDLRMKLLATGDKLLVEASPVDTRWGIGLPVDDPRALDPQQWRGTNWLGEAIMEARLTIRDSSVNPSH